MYSIVWFHVRCHAVAIVEPSPCLQPNINKVRIAYGTFHWKTPSETLYSTQFQKSLIQRKLQYFQAANAPTCDHITIVVKFECVCVCVCNEKDFRFVHAQMEFTLPDNMHSLVVLRVPFNFVINIELPAVLIRHFLHFLPCDTNWLQLSSVQSYFNTTKTPKCHSSWLLFASRISQIASMHTTQKWHEMAEWLAQNSLWFSSKT